MIVAMSFRQLTTYLGPYVLMGIIAIIAIGVVVLVTLILQNDSKEKKARLALLEGPRTDTLADEIRKQFKEDDERKERLIYTASGMSKARVKETRSAFAFKEDKVEKGLTLDSEFDNGLDVSFDIQPDAPTEK